MFSLRSEFVLQVRKPRLNAGKSRRLSFCNPPTAACEWAGAQPCGRSSSGQGRLLARGGRSPLRNGGSARGLFPGGRGRRSAAPRPSRGHVSARAAAPGRAAVAASSAPGEGHGKPPGRVPPGRARRRLGPKAGSGRRPGGGARRALRAGQVSSRRGDAQRSSGPSRLVASGPGSRRCRC